LPAVPRCALMVACPNSPAAALPMPVRNAGTFITVTCASARSRSAPASRMTKTRGDGIAGSIPAVIPVNVQAALQPPSTKPAPAWRVFLSKRTEADFQEWRDREAWTAEKYRRFDRGERMPLIGNRHNGSLVADRGPRKGAARRRHANACGLASVLRGCGQNARRVAIASET